MSIIDQAKHIIEGDREQAYGRPGENLRKISEQWSLYISQQSGVSVTLLEEDVCWMMVLLKMARQMHRHKEDNLVDAIGYIALIEKVFHDGRK